MGKNAKIRYSLGKNEFKKDTKLWQALVAECLGCFIMNLFGGLSYGAIQESNLYRSFGFGLVMFITVNFTFSISGGHLNPSISLSYLVIGRISLIRCLLYFIVQLGGACIGSLMLMALAKNDYFVGSAFGPNVLNSSITPAKAFGIEFFLGLILNLTVCSVNDTGRTELLAMAPFSIGMNIAVGHLACIKLSGAGMNPARSFGAAVMADFWDDHWIFWAGPILGGITGALLYVLIFEKGEVKHIVDEDDNID